MNNLQNELSPYLLQHANNPINWYPWGPEAFKAAKEQDKPIFLSIGYSSCHWCHVMERECFNDQEVAELMNDACIAIKVDREERPDLDDLFMEICKLQNGSGGWPLNIFLTPDGRPFFSTTWLPKRTKGKMPGLTDIIPRVKWLWLMQKEHIMRAANELAGLLKDRMKSQVSKSRGGRIGAYASREALNKLKELFDAQWGGFGAAPKFPMATRLLFLLRQA
ncbi:MAG: thioredoxin domain-containing protein, partial [Synergistaceae bacterium]|nr:thioredoxin domain-containing protein [Synergistaceae bacterium]